MKILIVGSGAREHAIARALQRSPQKPQIFCCGTHHNPGIQALTTNYWVGDISDIEAVVKVAREWGIDIAIIGPEAPLEKGLADILWDNAIATVGPKKKLARIETSKSFARELLKKYRIPGSPKYKVFHSTVDVKEFLQQLGADNYVVKADGLMGGKGVKVAGDHLHSFAEAYAFCETLVAQGSAFVIEEKCVGQEFSLLSFCDGHSLVPMPVVQDHKRAFVNDEGPNTGGMGSYSAGNHSLPFLRERDIEKAQHINEALLTALTAEYREKYIGILYGSFMATKDGVRLIEYNVRFGDPEAMNVLAILESDFVAICQALVTGRLSPSHVSFANLATVCKYAVPEGYPDHPVKDAVIDVSEVQHPEQLYLAAVDAREGQLIATGSRAAAVVGVAHTIAEAEKIAEEEINRIHGKLFHRADIGTTELIQRRIKQMEELRQCSV
jgi:phosphoribosylamine--glycine ligase